MILHARIRLWLVGAGLAASPVFGATDSLKDAAPGSMLIGTALSARQARGQDEAGVAVIDEQFNTVTPENAMKWETIHPEPGRYDFALADKVVEFGERHHVAVIGHTLMWHSQTPDWVFRSTAGGEVSREELLRRLREHIQTVVGRYRGKVKGWDVVNEAVRDEDGKLRTDKPWYRILGEEGIFAAYEAAHAADPDAELYYNDYSLANPVKRAGASRLALAVRQRGLRIDGIGEQAHVTLDWPKPAALDRMVESFNREGLKVMITELDVTMLPRPDAYVGADIAKVYQEAPQLDPYREGLPPAQQNALARRYREIFEVLLKYPGVVTRVTFWGVSDRESWLNGWPIRGRHDYPLLFDRDHRPKPAYAAVLEALRTRPAAK